MPTVNEFSLELLRVAVDIVYDLTQCMLPLYTTIVLLLNMFYKCL